MTGIPEELKQLNQWVMWKYVKREGQVKPTKPPFQTSGEFAKSNDPKTWTNYISVIDSLSKNKTFDGIGYMFSKDDPYVGIDLDNCIDLATGEIQSWALDIINKLDSYTEFSPSGKGIHIIAKGQLLKAGKNKQIEIYDKERYFTFTGKVFGTYKIIAERQNEIDKLYHDTFSKPDRLQGGTPVTNDLSDNEIIDLARRAANKDKFVKLFHEGNIEDYNSESEADQALANLITFYTRDPEQIERIMRQSELVRDKWDNHKDYLPVYTIPNAIKTVTEQYKPKKKTSTVITNNHELPIDDKIALKNRFIKEHGDNLKYCTLWGKWLMWNKSRWLIDETEAINKRAEQTALQVWESVPKETDQQKREQLISAYKRLSDLTNRDKLLRDARKDVAITPDMLDKDQWLLNVENGTIDLKTGKLLSQDRDNLITKLAPVKYDKAAEAPLFKEFLNQIFEGNENLINFVQKAIGYSLTGSIREQVMFFMYGTGANGKSTLIDLIQDMLGDYAMQTPTSTLMVKSNEGVPNDIARLKGSRFVSAVESEEGKKLSEVLVKQLTGGDTISARFMRAEWFDFKPEFKLMMATNHKPIITGTDHAIWRRIRMIPFSVTIPEDKRDKDLPLKLREELPGILNWAIEGCLRWQKEGLQAPDEVKFATDEYRAEMDILAGFIDDFCICNPLAKVKKSEIYDTYKTWCFGNGEIAITKKAFGMRLKERGFSDSRPGGIHYWNGIGLRKDIEGLQVLKETAAISQF